MTRAWPRSDPALDSWDAFHSRRAGAAICQPAAEILLSIAARFSNWPAPRWRRRCLCCDWPAPPRGRRPKPSEARDRGRRRHRRAVLRLRIDGARTRRDGPGSVGPHRRPREDDPRSAARRICMPTSAPSISTSPATTMYWKYVKRFELPLSGLSATQPHAAADRWHLVHARSNCKTRPC